MSDRLLRLPEIADVYGERLAERAARAAVRKAADGEPCLTKEEIEHVEADLIHDEVI